MKAFHVHSTYVDKLFSFSLQKLCLAASILRMQACENIATHGAFYNFWNDCYMCCYKQGFCKQQTSNVLIYTEQNPRPNFYKCQIKIT